MGRKKINDIGQLPLDTMIELVAIRNGKAFKKVLPYGEALKVKRKEGWKYIHYQLGFSQFKN